MGLDPRFVLAPSLEMYFVNKDDGTPLSNGKVYFWEDNARSIPKPVYEISGTPPNYSYTVLPNPVTLSSVGTFQDGSGNNILPYYFPFDGTPDTTTNTIDLYYIEVFDQDGVLQFTREGWPNFTEANVETDQDVTNFVPNGQFLLHNNIPAWNGNTFIVNQIPAPTTTTFTDSTGNFTTTPIAEGGWTFERNSASTAKDLITFPAFGSAVSSPTGNPIYALKIQTTLASADTRKDLCLKFNGVNTFASGTQAYNFYFEAKSDTGSTLPNVQLLLRKYFGTGGSATTETAVTSFTLGTSYSSFNASILFGTNENKTIGTAGDDYVQIVLRLPPTGIQAAEFDDFALTINEEKLTAFPTQTEAQQIGPSLAGWTTNPDFNAMDLYLPIRLGPEGFVFDDSNIGKIVASTNLLPGIGELICNGTTYRTNDYSSDGIPYARLQAKLFNGTVPIYGTGSTFVTATQETGVTNDLIFSTNTFGTATAPADGAVPTTFTFTPIHLPASAGFGLNAYLNGTNILRAISTATNAGLITSPNAHTSGFTIVDDRNIDTTTIKHSFTVQTIAAAGIPAGGYWTFSTNNPGLTPYYMWFTINGAGVNPAPGGTEIKVDLLSTMSAQDVAVVVSAALNAGRQTLIVAVAASAVTAGSYWTFGTPNSNSYYVWYKKDGAGTDPAVVNATEGIEVDILSADTSAQVAAKTALAINKAYFAVPDLRGVFLRGYDPTTIWDYESGSRWGNIPGVYGDMLGTFELDDFLSHIHSAAVYSLAAGHNALFSNQDTGGAQSSTAFTEGTGGPETNPVNAYVYWMIKY